MELKESKKKEYSELEKENQDVEENESRKDGRKIAVLAGVGALAAVLLIVGCAKGCGGSRQKEPDSMQAVFEQYLEADGNAFDALDSLSEAEQQKVISTAIATLEKLIGDGSSGYDREAVISELEKVLADLNLGLPESTIHTIAEKIVELYTNSYNEVYTDVEKTNTSIKHLGDTVTNQMKENLYTITDYLTQLDSEIVNNQSTLEQVINSNEEISTSVSELNEKTDAIRNQVSSSLTEIKNEFGTVQNQLNQTQDRLNEYFTKYDQNNAAINTGITNIQKDITDTKNQIAATQQAITDTLNEIENKNVSRQSEINKKFSEVSDSIKATQEQMKKLEENVSDAISDLSKDMQDNQEELVEILDDFESSMQKALSENMAAIDTHFSALQKSVDESFAKLQENIDFSVLELKAQMDAIHSQIQTTQDQITDILNAMDEKRDLQYQDIMDAINAAVVSINTEMQNAHANLEALILQMKADGEADHAETLQTLQGMESSLSEAMSSNLDQINNSFVDLNASLAQYFTQMKEEQGAGQEELGNAIGELGNDIRENQQVLLDGISAHDSANRQGQQEIKDAIKNHDANMIAGHEGLNSAIGTHNENVRGYIDALKSFLSEKLDQVFTYVSNGKKLLASALLTKGVTIQEDATFSEFADAIISVPQTIQVGELPGTIEYDYHYHLDADRNHVGEVKTNDRQGGCYTVAVYHTHSDSCYNWSHEHTDNCKSHPIWVDWVPNQEPYWGAIYDCGDQPANVRGSLKCGLPTSADGKPIYYELGCGLLDGQIVAAHIVYDKDSVSKASAFRMIAPVEEPIVADGVVGESEYPESIETEVESSSEDAGAEKSPSGTAQTDGEKKNASEESTDSETEMTEAESDTETETGEVYENDSATEASLDVAAIPDNIPEEVESEAATAESGISEDSASDNVEVGNTAEEVEVE